jgi:hypothetical protein
MPYQKVLLWLFPIRNTILECFGLPHSIYSDHGASASDDFIVSAMNGGRRCLSKSVLSDVAGLADECLFVGVKQTRRGSVDTSGFDPEANMLT